MIMLIHLYHAKRFYDIFFIKLATIIFLIYQKMFRVPQTSNLLHYPLTREELGVQRHQLAACSAKM
jgi:hypothetical protein